MNNQYLIICSEDEQLFLATRKIFKGEKKAIDYCKTIDPSWKPQIIHCRKKITEHNGTLRPKQPKVPKNETPNQEPLCALVSSMC